MALFEEELNVDQSPLDDTRITQLILYLDEPEALEFKRLCKKGMVAFYPSDFREANISKFLFDLIKKLYGENNIEKSNL